MKMIWDFQYSFVHHQQANSSSSYYVTFQVESGDRMELSIRGSGYGMLAEGDVGMLSFQGTRYLGYERETGGVAD